MNIFLILSLICIGCFVLYWILNSLSTKAYRWGHELLGNILAFFSFISGMTSAICLILTVIVLGRLIC